MSFKHGDHKHSFASEARECERAAELRAEGLLEGAGLVTHDDPCRCGPYDRCWGVRVEDARRAPTHNAAIRALHRAYND